MRASAACAVLVGLTCVACEHCAPDPSAEIPPPPGTGVVFGAGHVDDPDADPVLPWVPLSGRSRVAVDDSLFQLVLASEVVAVVHHATVGWSEFNRRASDTGAPTLEGSSHRSLTATVEQSLLGDPAAELRWDFYCGPGGADAETHWQVPCNAARRLVASGDRALVFLIHASHDILYFVQRDDALQEPTAATIEAIADHVRRLEEARGRFARLTLPDVDARVGGLVDRFVVGAAAQYDAMRELIAIGPAAVPSLVRRVGDRRAVASGAIVQENSPAAFEGLAHYSVGTVGDAIAYLLGLMTDGPGCHGLRNVGEDGEDEDARDRCEARWIGYAVRGLDETAFGPEWRAP